MSMRMAADIVKDLHRKLREDLRAACGDYNKVWKEHCDDQETLESYAVAMLSLATNQWCKNSPGGRSDWCVKICKEYFKGGGLDMLIEKQKKRIDKEMGTMCCCCLYADLISNAKSLKLGRTINLLDVGSCYNPFIDFKDEFFTVAIDLWPATEYVYKCDFLDLKIKRLARSRYEKAVACSCASKLCCIEEKSLKNDVLSMQESELAPEEVDLTTYLQKSPITEFPAGCFHVVVFSLLLSYFPSPVQRWNCCIKAHELLCMNGLLFIITPDSSHQNRNVDMVKSWKTAIESIGFVRWKYVKDTHVHCMVFRKVSPCHHSCSKNCSCNINVDVTPEMLYIRQDFHDALQHGVDAISEGVDSPISKKRKIETV